MCPVRLPAPQRAPGSVLLPPAGPGPRGVTFQVLSTECAHPWHVRLPLAGGLGEGCAGGGYHSLDPPLLSFAKIPSPLILPIRVMWHLTWATVGAQHGSHPLLSAGLKLPYPVFCCQNPGQNLVPVNHLKATSLSPSSIATAGVRGDSQAVVKQPLPIASCISSYRMKA